MCKIILLFISKSIRNKKLTFFVVVCMCCERKNNNHLMSVLERDGSIINVGAMRVVIIEYF